MTPDGLKELIDGGESLDVEFKSESAQPLSDRDLLEAVVCLANRPGTGPGWLLVGVEDDGVVTGCRPRHEAGRTDPIRVRAMIANRTRPSHTVRTDVRPLAGKDVLIVEVPTSIQPVGTADGRYLRRALGGDGRPACLPYHFHEMQSRQADSRVLDYTALPVPDISWDDLEPLEFDRFRHLVRENRGRGDEALPGLGDMELAKALGAVETTGGGVVVRVMGLLLFGRQEALVSAVPAHEVAFQRLSGNAVEANDFFRWPLLRIMEELETRFRAYNRERETFVGMTRIGVPDYPARAYREGVANALVHRDYTRLGAVHVQWHEDRLEISSPGSFPEGVHLNNLLVTDPRPRNPLLADAFKRAGIVERTARGIDTIFEEQLRLGRPAPSYERSTTAGVTLVLPGGEADLHFVRLRVEEERDNGPLSHQALLLLDHLRLAGGTPAADAATVIQLGHDSATRNLLGLVDRGLVEVRGKGRRRSYQLSAATCRRLRIESEYLHPPGFTPEEQERRVEAYTLTRGRITRREAVEVCKISPAQATRLLRRLVEKGSLARHGEKRGTWYTSTHPDADRMVGMDSFLVDDERG
ncbi:ATP-binding protein [Candidatus Palauibacter sp.]|uniref:ATP-binding protein n=1 Tax=Candidatus Palauibacter sp. TaxID=3101350 RepID=UPI003B5AAABB